VVTVQIRGSNRCGEFGSKHGRIYPINKKTILKIRKYPNSYDYVDVFDFTTSIRSCYGGHSIEPGMHRSAKFQTPPNAVALL